MPNVFQQITNIENIVTRTEPKVDTAITEANGAKNTANAALTEARNAGVSAGAAEAAASAAEVAAENASSRADTAAQNASAAVAASIEAKDVATEARDNAATATISADNAYTAASDAASKADNAEIAASSASTNAVNASTRATEARDVADEARVSASAAETAATQASAAAINAQSASEAAAAQAGAANVTAQSNNEKLDQVIAMLADGGTQPNPKPKPDITEYLAYMESEYVTRRDKLNTMAATGGDDARKIYSLENAIAGLADTAEALYLLERPAAEVAVWLDRATDLAMRAIASHPWTKINPPHPPKERDFLEDIKGTQGWPRLVNLVTGLTRATDYPILHQRAHTIEVFVRDEILGYHVPLPQGNYSNAWEWAQNSHREVHDPDTNPLGGIWHGHATMLARVASELYVATDSDKDEARKTLAEFLTFYTPHYNDATAILYAGAIGDGSPGGNGQPVRNTFKTGREMRWLVEAYLDGRAPENVLTGLVETLEGHIFQGVEEGYPVLAELIDGTSPNELGNANLYEGILALIPWSRQAYDLGVDGHNILVNGPFSPWPAETVRLFYYLNFHEDGFRQLGLVGMLLLGIARDYDINPFSAVLDVSVP